MEYLEVDGRKLRLMLLSYDAVEANKTNSCDTMHRRLRQFIIVVLMQSKGYSTVFHIGYQSLYLLFFLFCLADCDEESRLA